MVGWLTPRYSAASRTESHSSWATFIYYYLRLSWLERYQTLSFNVKGKGKCGPPGGVASAEMRGIEGGRFLALVAMMAIACHGKTPEAVDRSDAAGHSAVRRLSGAQVAALRAAFEAVPPDV